MPLTNTWLPAENFVRNAVRKNYTIALKVSTFHFNALTAAAPSDPAIAAQLVIFTPFHTNVVNTSSTKDGAAGSRKSDTQAKDQLFLIMTQEKMPMWRQMISNVYMPGTPGFTNLFPHGMDDFYKGTIENKLLHLKTLCDKCNLDAALTAVATLITSFYGLISAARGNQEGEKTLVGVAIANQKAAIEAMCIQHFVDYGVIVTLHPNEPTIIRSFVDVATMQSHVHSNVYQGTVNSNKIKMVATKKSTPTTKIKVTCDVDCQVWVNDSAKNKAHPIGVFIPANTPTTAAFPDLGNFLNRVYQIHNLDLTTKGHYSVEFL